MIKKAILVVTWKGTLNYCYDLLESIKHYKGAEIVVALNDCEDVPSDHPFFDYLRSNDISLLPIQGNRWECGGMTAIMAFTDYDEFVLIQDTLEIKDTIIFDMMFAKEGKSIAFGRDWLCYLGKYRREVLNQFPIPICLTKMDAYYNEHMVANIYMYVAEKIEGSKVEVLFPDWTNDNPLNYFEEKFERKNLVLYNPFVVKRKSLYWNYEPGYTIEVWHKGESDDKRDN